MSLLKKFVHTDRFGVPVRCAACKQIINHPAVKIDNSTKETSLDGPYIATWSVEYNFYHYECARKHLSGMLKPWWKFW